MRRRLLVVLALAALAVAGACGNDNTKAASGASTTAAAAPVTIRLGYFPNVTHATAIVGVEKGLFAKALGTDTLETKTFNAGPEATEALLSGAIDATYIGPNPAINAFVKSKGGIKIISGATSGGAALVVKPSITSAAQLKGKKIASPQLGNTQDVALRSWLKDQGLNADPQGGGDVSIVPQENSLTLDAFKAGQIDGAWVPEPWVSRLVTDGGGKVLVDEKTLWPGGKFVTTHLIVRTAFLKDHPQTVERLLEGQVAANDYLAANAAEAQTVVNGGILKITQKKLADAVIASAFKNLSFTDDPIAASLKTSADHAVAVGLLQKPDLTGIYDLTLLNSVLKAKGETAVKGL
ncbi:MAG: sulfonate transport system substrate-binding protein [Actinomycetota bacterium]|nr:sulfonate transport system substrate-binding protein [Actinomycetota bacterium]